MTNNLEKTYNNLSSSSNEDVKIFLTSSLLENSNYKDRLAIHRINQWIKGKRGLNISTLDKYIYDIGYEKLWPKIFELLATDNDSLRTLELKLKYDKALISKIRKGVKSDMRIEEAIRIFSYYKVKIFTK